jgi:hypothetical protein
MAFEVYGNYVEGLEQDAEKILNYLGRDFILPEMKQHAIITRQQALIPHLPGRCSNRCNRLPIRSQSPKKRSSSHH